jgi:hypothetical protein
VVVAVADTGLNQLAVQAVQVVVAVAVVIIIQFMHQHTVFINRQLEIMHALEQIIPVVVVAPQVTTLTIHTEWVAEAALELLLLDINRKNYERNTKN